MIFFLVMNSRALSGRRAAIIPPPQHDSAYSRRAIWQHLASDWKPIGLSEIATSIELDAVGDAVQRILKGEIAGRVVVTIR